MGWGSVRRHTLFRLLFLLGPVDRYGRRGSRRAGLLARGRGRHLEPCAFAASAPNGETWLGLGGGWGEVAFKILNYGRRRYGCQSKRFGLFDKDQIYY